MEKSRQQQSDILHHLQEGGNCAYCTQRPYDPCVSLTSQIIECQFLLKVFVEYFYIVQRATAEYRLFLLVN